MNDKYNNQSQDTYLELENVVFSNYQLPKLPITN